MTAWFQVSSLVYALTLASRPSAAPLFAYVEPLLAGRRLWIFMGAVLAAGVLWIVWRMRMLSWPLTQGKIETVNVSTIRSLERGSYGTRESCTAEVSYSYSVAGEFYSGYWTQHFTDEQAAWDFVGPLKGQEVLVRYDPKHPEKSALASPEE